MRRLVAAVVAAVLGAALLTACGGGDDEPAVQTVAEPEPLRVVALGDSNVAGWGLRGDDGARFTPEDAYPYRYAELLAAELDVEVRTRSWFPDQVGNEVRTLAEWAAALEADEEMAAEVARADIVLLLVGFHDLVPALLYGACPGTWPEMEACVGEVTSAMPAGFDAFYGRIADLTGGDATVLVADYGIPPAFWDRWGDDPHWTDIQRVVFEDWRAMLVAAADDHGFVVVPTSHELNEPGGRPVEDLTSDGFHFAAAGHERMARIHQDHDGITATAACPPGADADRAGGDGGDGERPANAGAEAAVALDRARGRLLALGWASSGDDQVTTWAFDLCTNAWTALRPGVEPSVGAIARLVFDEDSDVAVAFGHATPTTPWVYEPDANTWTPLPRDPTAPELELLRPRDFAYDSRAGDIVLHDSWTGGLWAYDVEANTWSELPQGDVVPTEHDSHSLLTYDRRAGRLVLAVIERETWRYSRVAGTWQRGGDPLRQLNTGYFETGGEITFDERIGRVVVYSDTTLAAYDTVDDRWSTVEAPDDDLEFGERARLGHAFVHDPVNGRDVLVLGQARLADGWRPARSVWAFDHADGTWTELVPG